MSESNNNTNASDNADDKNNDVRSLLELILSTEWNKVEERCRSHPSEIRSCIDPETGRSPLHVACAIGSCPLHIIQLIANGAPEMLTQHDTIFGDTPLHILCRNGQRTSCKIAFLLHLANDPEYVLMRNIRGGTPLHSACGHNAMIPNLQLLVQTCPKVVKQTTYDHCSVLTALWNAYVQTIPGHLVVARLLQGKGGIPTDSHFERFWNKVKFVALENWKLVSSSSCADDSYIIHALLQFGANIALFKIALKLAAMKRVETVATATTDSTTTAAVMADETTAASTESSTDINATSTPLPSPFSCGYCNVVDHQGNLPIHTLLERRPFRLKEEFEALKAMVAVYPEACGVVQSKKEHGQLALFIAIRNKIGWESGLREIVKAMPLSLLKSARDSETGLYPFQLSAMVGGRAALDSTYQLLSTLPELCC